MHAKTSDSVEIFEKVDNHSDLHYITGMVFPYCLKISGVIAFQKIFVDSEMYFCCSYYLGELPGKYNSKLFCMSRFAFEVMTLAESQRLSLNVKDRSEWKKFSIYYSCAISMASTSIFRAIFLTCELASDTSLIYIISQKFVVR